MDDPLYRDFILEHYQHPQNYGILDKPDLDVTGNNRLCGDSIRITIKHNGTIIEKILFASEGCAISKAGASLFTEMIKGKKIKDVMNIKPEDFLKTLEIELSPARIKCALLAYSTLQNSLKK